MEYTLFLHKDEFIREFPKLKNTALPAVFYRDDQNMCQIISRDEIGEEENAGGLMELVNAKIEGLILPNQFSQYP